MDVLNQFVDKKKADSQFISLADGESVVINHLMDIQMVRKLGFGGTEVEVLRLTCAVETCEGMREKTFDNGTKKFAEELQAKGVKIGSGFVLTRIGMQTKTRYNISQVKKGFDGTMSSSPANPGVATPVTPVA
jgi:hypothetical protein